MFGLAKIGRMLNSMKKTLFLAILPAVLILSACSGITHSDNLNLMAEDTLAHEEIFGSLPNFDFKEESDSKILMPKKALTPGELYSPVLGFQKVHDDVNHVYNIRFVAAIENTIESVVWTRGVSNIAGTVAPKKGVANKDVDHIYSTLSDNGAHTAATGVKAKEDDEVSPFSYFAVYCLLNIPDAYEDYYVHAYVTVSDGTNSKKSSVGALKIKTGEHTEYSFINDQDGRDAALVNGQVVESVAHNEDKVSMLSYHLSAGDKVEIIYIDQVNLKFVKNSSLAIGDGRAFPDFSLDQETDVLTTTYSGTYNVFLNGSNKFYFEKKIYFQGYDKWEEWSSTNYDTYIQVKPNGGTGSYDEWKMDLVSGHLYATFVDTSLKEDAQFFLGSIREKWTGYKGSSLKAGKDLYTASTETWSVYGE